MMNADDLRSAQAPLKERYRETTEAAMMAARPPWKRCSVPPWSSSIFSRRLQERSLDGHGIIVWI